jgi:hypothetical protein
MHVGRTNRRDFIAGLGGAVAWPVVATFAAFVALVGGAIAAEPVDLLLVLASDVSHSVDDAKFKLQRDGYVAAISDSRVIKVIRSGPHGRIAICFVEWSGHEQQRVVIDWMLIDGTKAAQDFASQLDEAPRSFAMFTSISGGIDFAMAQLKRAPFHSERHTIDVSGDGTNNSGRSVIAARDDAVAQGVTINGLVILSELPLEHDPFHTHPVGGLDAYYRENVVGGPNSFVIAAANFNAFGKAMLNKLIAEIADADGPEGTRFADLRAWP